MKPSLSSHGVMLKSVNKTGTKQIKLQHKLERNLSDLMSFIPDKDGEMTGINSDLNPLYNLLSDLSPPATSLVRIIIRVKMKEGKQWIPSLSGFGQEDLKIEKKIKRENLIEVKFYTLLGALKEQDVLRYLENKGVLMLSVKADEEEPTIQMSLDISSLHQQSAMQDEVSEPSGQVLSISYKAKLETGTKKKGKKFVQLPGEKVAISELL